MAFHFLPDTINCTLCLFIVPGLFFYGLEEGFLFPIRMEGCHVNAIGIIQGFFLILQCFHGSSKAFFQGFILPVFQAAGGDRNILSIDPSCFQVQEGAGFDGKVCISIHKAPVRHGLCLQGEALSIKFPFCPVFYLRRFYRKRLSGFYLFAVGKRSCSLNRKVLSGPGDAVGRSRIVIGHGPPGMEGHILSGCQGAVKLEGSSAHGEAPADVNGAIVVVYFQCILRNTGIVSGNIGTIPGNVCLISG